MLYHPLCL